MKMLDVNKLIASAESCLGWPYVSPGTNDARGIDCSGLFVKWFRDQGASIYHGSNTIYRKYCSEKGKLTSVSLLRPGMAVFKWNPNTPEKFNDGLGDFQHIGLVTSVNPLRIVHASTGTMCVTTDTKLGKWAYWGKLKNVAYPDKTATQSSTPDSFVREDATVNTEQSKVQVRLISSGGKVNIRRGNGTNYARITSAAPGTKYEHIATAHNGWHAVKVGTQIGWVSPDFSIIEQ